jgi:RNA polymerase sigma factor (sigma-70 family)
LEGIDDLRLLRRYAADGCAHAFEVIVRRHIAWIYSASVRQVGDAELAEDVTQAVFAILARRASSIPDQTVLRGWLFNTMRFTAKEARRQAARRRTHEARAAVAADACAAPPEADPAWEAMAPQLEEAIASLQETDRQALLLRYYEARDFPRIAQAMGVKEPTARKRVTRAVQRLRHFFKRRGIVMPAVALAATLLARATRAAPAQLAVSVSAVCGGGTLTPIARALVTTILRMARARRRIATAVAACLIVLGIGVIGLLAARFAEALAEPTSLPGAGPAIADTWPVERHPLAEDAPALPSRPIRARLTVEAAPPAPSADRLDTPPFGIDALTWIRDAFDPARALGSAPQARGPVGRAPAGAPAPGTIDPVTGEPVPSVPPGEPVESNSQMGGGGGGGGGTAHAAKAPEPPPGKHNSSATAGARPADAGRATASRSAESPVVNASDTAAPPGAPGPALAPIAGVAGNQTGSTIDRYSYAQNGRKGRPVGTSGRSEPDYVLPLSTFGSVDRKWYFRRIVRGESVTLHVTDLSDSDAYGVLLDDDSAVIDVATGASTRWDNDAQRMLITLDGTPPDFDPTDPASLAASSYLQHLFGDITPEQVLVTPAGSGVTESPTPETAFATFSAPPSLETAGAVFAAVPEPASGLLVAGLALQFAARRTRQSARRPFTLG